MARLEERFWEPGGLGLTRQDRRPCRYFCYLPDGLAGRPIAIDGDVAADVAAAESELVLLNASAAVLINADPLARLLLRVESVASSRIEGLVVGSRRLLRSEMARQLGEEVRDGTVAEVLSNIDAMVWCLETVAPGGRIEVETLLEAHRRLMAGGTLRDYGGRLRTAQNWIGGSSYNPCSAQFVPPPPEAVPGLLDDLARFCNDDGLPPLVQAAVAHSQFETIHPFVDGNGRVGRALIHLVLRRRGIAVRLMPPVSLVLATWVDDYVSGLTATRYVDAVDSVAAHSGLNRWVAIFAGACRRAVADAREFERQVGLLQESWRGRVGHPRRDSAVQQLVEVLPAAPVLTVSSVAGLIGRSFQATNQGISRLTEAGVLRQVSIGRRNRAFECPDLMELFTALERRLASPMGDTRVSAPVRDVPVRF